MEYKRNKQKAHIHKNEQTEQKPTHRYREESSDYQRGSGRQREKWIKGVSCMETKSSVVNTLGLPGGTSGKESACQGRRSKRPGFHPWVGRTAWRRKWQHTPVLLPGESHGQKSLVGYSPRGGKESDVTEHTHTHIHEHSSETYMNVMYTKV